MAFPDDRLSTAVEEAEFQPPDDRSSDLTTDYEQGPVDINDTSGGMSVQPWVMTYVDPDVIVTPEVLGTQTTVISVAGITQCTFCFDQNARPVVAYTTAASTFLYWYDTFEGQFVTTDLGSDVIRPALALDDKRETELSANDVLLHYTKSDGQGGWKLYQKRQRDRFANEIELIPPVGTVINQYIRRNGMHDALRFQIGTSST